MEVYLTHLPVHDSSRDVFKAPHDASFLRLPSSVTNHLFRSHVHIFSPVCLLLSPVYNLCDHCCFSAWFSSSSAWMNSDQIKLALTDSDLPSPSPAYTTHTRIPRVHTLLSSLFANTSPSIRLLTFRLLLSS